MGTAELPTSYLAAHNPVYGTLRDAKKSILFKILYLKKDSIAYAKGWK
jgi:hypothetical protein